MGDGILVYFGYPQAHEDEAEMAVAAGLAVLEATASLDGAVRIGIATGRVVVGDLLGTGPAQERTVVGETPNLAARLQGLANPDTIVVSETTEQLARGGFDFTDLGRHKLKGFAEPASAWQVVAAKAAESRFETRHGTSLTRLVGRDAELMLLQERWQQAQGGEGQTVFISGEAGIGKSKLLEGLRDHVAERECIVIRYQCSPHHSNSALYPTIRQLEHAAGFASIDEAADKLDNLEALLRQAGDDIEADAPLFAHLLSLPFESRYGALEQSPPQIKARTLEALVCQLLGLAQRSPVLYLFEDIHWIDPTSQEMLELVIGRLQRARVLLVVTHRPEWRLSFSGHSNLTSLQLNRLGNSTSAEIVRAIAGDYVPHDVVERIVSRTDGIPLFIEELTKSLVEGGLNIADRDIPATLQASLLARVDRLGSQAKELAQIGAIIGREFQRNLLVAVTQVPEAELDSALGQLAQSELVFKAGTPSEVCYSFKHALIQDTIYDSMLSEVRQGRHARIAAALEAQFPDTAKTRADLLAHHYTEAHLTEKAIEYWQLAGRRSSQRSATVEAIAQLQKGLELLDTLPPSAERDRTELGLRIDLTTPLIASKGMAAPEMAHTITRARELCERLGETTRLFPILYGQWVFHHVSGQVVKGLEFAKEASRLAESESGEVPAMVAHRTLGIALIGLGRPHEARSHLARGNEFYDAERHRPLALVYGMDFKQVNLAYLALADWFDGYPERALAVTREGVDFARSISHANSLCHALALGAGTLHTFNRQFVAAKEVGEELLRLSAEHGMPQWSLFGRMYVAFGFIGAGQDKKGISKLQECIEKCRAVPMLANSTLAYSILAQSQARNKAYRDALISIGHGESVIESGGERWARSEFLRLKGEILDAQSGYAEAEHYLRSAIDVAREQPAKLLELRAATSLARLWRRQGKVYEARNLLAPLYGWFTDGTDTADLKEAHALLAELN